MKATFLASLIVLAACGAAAEEPFRFHVSAGAGPSFGSGGTHLGSSLDYSITRHLALGGDLGYSQLPLAPQARGGGIKVLYGYLTLAATAAPSSRVSPYAVIGYGLGRYTPSSGEAELGKAGSLGAGLRVRLSSRASLFVESRFAAVGGITAADGAHFEIPVRIGVRVGL